MLEHDHLVTISESPQRCPKAAFVGILSKVARLTADPIPHLGLPERERQRRIDPIQTRAYVRDDNLMYPRAKRIANPVCIEITFADGIQHPGVVPQLLQWQGSHDPP